ncbi:hypothetical protein [Rummeliibacillus suwonensis]|uniref:hypothetical protein n=1 Tax=Rummeliibacillus suwonensis TaxID=1306154 RepID=UPI0028975127|nr:hypothetical protein [Rummeliibacillus suwonensis]
MTNENELEKYIGRKAYKNSGYFSGLVGRIEKSDFITRYKLIFDDGGAVGINRLMDIVLLEGEKND